MVYSVWQAHSSSLTSSPTPLPLDLDGNGVWDESEVKALFLKELDKLYDPNASEDDIMERQEEMERMREHIFSEADVDRDDLIR